MKEAVNANSEEELFIKRVDHTNLLISADTKQN